MGARYLVLYLGSYVPWVLHILRKYIPNTLYFNIQAHMGSLDSWMAWAYFKGMGQSTDETDFIDVVSLQSAA